MSLKSTIHTACLQLLDEKISNHQTSLHQLTQGMANDTKSSAGDKHETARAMMQLEYEKTQHQLQEVTLQKKQLERINTALISKQIINGSLIKTDKGYLFLSIAIGRINVNGVDVIVLSQQSPLGKQLLGLKQNDVAVINTMRYVIQEIC